MITTLKDKAQSWTMNPDGSYTREPADEDSLSAHVYFMTNPSLSGRGSARKNGKTGKRQARAAS